MIQYFLGEEMEEVVFYMKIAKKLGIYHLIIALLVGLVASSFAPMVTYADNSPQTLNLQVNGAILVEASTGKILYEQNANQPLPPASMTKMMTEYLLLEAISEGKIAWDDVTVASEYVFFLGREGGSRAFIGQGEKYTVRQLFEAMAVFSANDATVMLTEHFAGSETNFVNMMNQRAKEWGMNNTHFITSTGFPEEELGEYRPAIEGTHYMTAVDAAILGRKLITDHPEVTQFTTTAKAVFREGTSRPLNMDNWNRLLPGLKYEYPGVDGLKTGSTPEAGYCLTATAERNGMRLISVVFGAEDDDKRFQETIKLLDFGFNNYELLQLQPSGAKIEGHEIAKVNKGVEKEVGIVLGESYKTVIRKGEESLYTVMVETNPDALTAPLTKGTEIGIATIEYLGNEKYRYLEPADATNDVKPMIVEEDVDKGSWIRLFFRAIVTFIVDIFSQISKTIGGWFS